jgi:hypothetical protein
MPTTQDATDANKRAIETLDGRPAGKGDNRGRFGFGRPAHGSDPEAHYEFAGSVENASAGEQSTGADPDADSGSRHKDEGSSR